MANRTVLQVVEGGARRLGPLEAGCRQGEGEGAEHQVGRDRYRDNRPGVMISQVPA